MVNDMSSESNAAKRVDKVAVTEIDEILLKACIAWDGKQTLEELEELQAWLQENPRNRKILRVFEDLLKRQRRKAEE